MSEPVAIGAGAPADPDPLATDDLVDAVAAFVDDLVEGDGAEAIEDGADDAGDDAVGHDADPD